MLEQVRKSIKKLKKSGDFRASFLFYFYISMGYNLKQDKAGSLLGPWETTYLVCGY